MLATATCREHGRNVLYPFLGSSEDNVPGDAVSCVNTILNPDVLL